ncbi:hypothetical protein STRTUCAR8_01280 [Streptomyces turgidiscabies Car8]|uniref:Uncharacterized protein n=1 Tax=Streptomyces turgidiscabies (strain Car8) TaxID=698760 RepID=L7F2S9_STRT8|nr:hypothetical protein STRTUCAR8_01280 [Streptomyces turgidiscabies Car8]
MGQMLASTVDTTAVIVVRCPDQEVEITCGGAAMAETNGPGGPAATGTADPGLMGGNLLGKRYAAEDLGLELLCTKQGQGTLAANGVPLPVKSPKPLPASD